MKHNIQTDMEIRIEKRPLTHYIVSVTSRDANALGAGRMRDVVTYPVSVDEMGRDTRPLIDGEKVIDCVSAVPGSVEVFVCYLVNSTRFRVALGVEVPGADAPNWVRCARNIVSEHVGLGGED